MLPDHSMDARIAAARQALGEKCVILGHHYQRDEVIRFADFQGDSYKLSQHGRRRQGRYIVFAASISWRKAPTSWRAPDSRSSCPTSTPAARWPTWPKSARRKPLGAIGRAGPDHRGRQRAYADYLHQLRGGHQGLLRGAGRRGLHLVQRAAALQLGLCAQSPGVFLPDQHLARNTGYAMGIPLDEMVVWDPFMPRAG